MKTITSTSNTYIKFIRGLQSARGRKKSGKYFIEGIHLVDECVKNKYPLESILFCTEILRSDYALDLINNLQGKDIDVIEVSEDVFLSIANKEGPQGLAAVGLQKYSDPKTQEISGLWIALEDIQDPGNLGTILRSLDGAGGSGMILVGETTNPFHPTAVRSSAGALFRLPILQMDRQDLISFKNDRNLFTVGTVCDLAPSYRSVNYPSNLILVMGSEQKGLSEDIVEICDQLITIPMGGQIDSLNLSNAASIVLFEIYAKGFLND